MSRSDIGFLSWSEEVEAEKKKQAKKMASLSTLSKLSKTFKAKTSFKESDKGYDANDSDDGEQSLVFELKEMDHRKHAETMGVGSRLKTPLFPVWVTLCKETYGLLFNPNKELTRDYHAENR